MTDSDPADDPFAAHLKRDPLPGAGIRIIAITDLPAESAERIVASITESIGAMGRAFECSIVSPTPHGLGVAFELALRGACLPLVLVTTATEPWTAGHLEPLLQAIDKCDHVIGCRHPNVRGGASDIFAGLARRLMFGVSFRDIHSPCRLHRLDKIASIPLQSRSSFLDTEIFAKATFLAHVMDEVAVPPLRGQTVAAGWWADCHQILREPRFKRLSGPAEETQCEEEGADRPGCQDQERRRDIE
jgi:hypothetical protein